MTDVHSFHVQPIVRSCSQEKKKQQSELKLFQVTIDMVAIRQVILGTWHDMQQNMTNMACCCKRKIGVMDGFSESNNTCGNCLLEGSAGLAKEYK